MVSFSMMDELMRDLQLPNRLISQQDKTGQDRTGTAASSLIPGPDLKSGEAGLN